MDTNNGVEAQNKLLKYSYLPNRKNITLSSLVSHIIESFLPDRYQKYLLQNYQMTEAYRSYSASIPEYLRTRPRSVIIHCLDRVRKANKFSSTDVQEGESEGCFNVTSQSGKVHHVDLGVTSRGPLMHMHGLDSTSYSMQTFLFHLQALYPVVLGFLAPDISSKSTP